MVSIIVLTYNRFELLKKTLKSILNQTYKDFEIIIVNDGSSDDTPHIKSYITDERIRLFNLEKQNNLAKLRNYGVKQSKGKYIGFCDDDDLWTDTKLEIQMPLLDEYDFICSNAKLIDIEDRVLAEKYIKFENSKILKTKDLLLDNVIMPSSVIFHKKLLSDDKPFDEFNYINLCEDYNLWIKLSLIAKLYFLNEELILHRTHSSWARGSKNSQQIYRNHFKLLKPFTKSEDPEIRESAHLSMLNNKIYEMKNLSYHDKKFLAFTKLSGLFFLILRPEYFKAFYIRVKMYFENRNKIAKNK
jgi:glycosyltransferase involved in cell wall biosynthesis